MTTVGYGDVYAVSPFGRIISIINALWGAFIISLLVASIGKIFELSDNQKKAIVEITNSKKAAQTLRSSFDYFLAKKDLKKSQLGQRLDTGDAYVPSMKDVKKLKKKMHLAADTMRDERKSNIDLLPVDVNGNNIELVKEQVLDLNDKFDFLLSLLMKGQKLGVKVEHTTEGFHVIKGFSLQTQQIDHNHTLIPEECEFDPANDSHVHRAIREFEQKAKQTVGLERKMHRKPEPKKTLSERIKDAIKNEEELGNLEDIHSHGSLMGQAPVLAINQSQVE